MKNSENREGKNAKFSAEEKQAFFKLLSQENKARLFSTKVRNYLSAMMQMYDIIEHIHKTKRSASKYLFPETKLKQWEEKFFQYEHDIARFMEDNREFEKAADAVEKAIKEMLPKLEKDDPPGERIKILRNALALSERRLELFEKLEPGIINLYEKIKKLKEEIQGPEN